MPKLTFSRAPRKEKVVPSGIQVDVEEEELYGGAT